MTIKNALYAVLIILGILISVVIWRLMIPETGLSIIRGTISG